jgi:hypothetical protein
MRIRDAGGNPVSTNVKAEYGYFDQSGGWHPNGNLGRHGGNSNGHDEEDTVEVVNGEPK